MQRMVVLAAVASAATAQLVVGGCANDAECRELGDDQAVCELPVMGDEPLLKNCKCTTDTTVDSVTFGKVAANVQVCARMPNGVAPQIPVSFHARFPSRCSDFDFMSQAEFKRVAEKLLLGAVDTDIVVSCTGNVADVSAAVLATVERVSGFDAALPTTTATPLLDALRAESSSILGLHGVATVAQLVIDRQCTTAANSRHSTLDASDRCQPTMCLEGFTLMRTETSVSKSRDWNQWECVPTRPPQYDSDDDLTDAELAVIIVGAVLMVALVGVLFMVGCREASDAPAEKPDPETEPAAEPADEA